MTDCNSDNPVDGTDSFVVNNEVPYVSSNERNLNELMHMVVSSEEEAYNLYNEHAKRIGFSIRKGNTRYYAGTKNISQKEYYCSCHGFSRETNACMTKYRNRFETRTGCETMVRFSVKDDIWRVIKFVSNHNHELASQSEIHLLRSNRQITIPKANVISSMVNAGISTKDVYTYLSNEVGGREHIGFTKRDCYNYVNKEKMFLIEAGDSQSVINHFKLRQNQDAMFFYTVQVDQENRMTNFFWRDGRSRVDYDFFGDVVVFDTTFRTNKYDFVCAPFVGVNHHWQNIMFGCAFLLDETTSSFVWLFKSFLESMGGKAPITIITDQDQAMSNDIREVFPSTRHRLCQWHIAKNAPSHLGSLNSNPRFRELFYKCLHGCETEEEFQHTWDTMMDEFSELRDHKWLKNLYNIRKKWSLALNKDVFSCDIRSSQRSESTNHVSNGIANKTTSLTKFVLSFEDLLTGWRYQEGVEDFNCKKGLPSRVIQNSGMLNQAAEVYTHKIFLLFQKELLDGIATNWSEITCEDGVFSFQVMGEHNNSRTRIVHFDATNMDISCTCKKFESMGLLCSHVLKILVVKNVTRIPEKYIVSRWTKDAKRRILESEKVELSQDNLDDTKIVFRNNMMRWAYDIIMKCQGNSSTRQMCREYLHKLDEDLCKELTRLQLNENDETKEKNVYEDIDPILNPPKAKPKEKVVSTIVRESALLIEERHVQHYSPTPTSMVQNHFFKHQLEPSQNERNSQMNLLMQSQGYGYNWDDNNRI